MRSWRRSRLTSLMRASGRAGRMPALSVALDRAILDELRHHAIQVVRLDLQTLGDLGDRDPRLSAHEVECLGRPGVATTPATWPACRSASGTAAASTGRTGRPARSTPATDQRRPSCLKLRDLSGQLLQTLIDVLYCAIYEIRQLKPPPGASSSYLQARRYTASLCLSRPSAVSLEQRLQSCQ
jgi:hypothetical protein